jgi:signal peptidase I
VRPPLESDSPLQSDWPDKPAGPPPPKRSSLAFLKELPVLILIAFGLAMLIKTFLVQAFFIPSGSMEPTLHGCPGCRGDRVLVNKLVYRFREPRRGEIVVFVGERDTEGDTRSFFRKIVDNITEGLGVTQPADKDFIKRVIGLPGETIQIRDGVVTITTTDGKKLVLNEPYLAQEKDLTPFGPTKVAPDSYFVLGDNRANSSDSRTHLGAIRRSDIIGKAFVKVWPLGRIGILKTPGYATPAAAGVLLALPVLTRLRCHRPLRSVAPRAA